MGTREYNIIVHNKNILNVALGLAENSHVLLYKFLQPNLNSWYDWILERNIDQFKKSIQIPLKNKDNGHTLPKT